MTGSRPPQITSFGRKDRPVRFPLASPPPAVSTSLNPEQVGTRYGWVEITAPERRYTRSKWRDAYVAVRCAGCGREGWMLLGNLTSGKSKGCQACSQARKAPLWLDRRVTSMRQRCTNPKDSGWENYGGRGIEFKFASVTEGALWVMHNLGLHRDKDLDRVDNNGHYEAGNLRYATRSQNMYNCRLTKLTEEDFEWAQTVSPLGVSKTRQYMARGYTRDCILGVAAMAVIEKRKNWKNIKARLEKLLPTTS